MISFKGEYIESVLVEVRADVDVAIERGEDYTLTVAGVDFTVSHEALKSEHKDVVCTMALRKLFGGAERGGSYSIH